MGGRFARNLVGAGYRVLGFDLSPGRIEEAAAGGVEVVSASAAAVTGADVVLTSMPSSEAWVTLAREVLVPGARSGQLFIDVGTVAPPETRRVEAQLKAAGAALVDAPLSGGPGGADRGSCFVFAGGGRADFERAKPILEVFGGSASGGRLTYCGPAGDGQVIKGVHQLAMGLGAAAYLEAVSFGVNAGVDAETVGAAIGDTTGWRSMVGRTAQRIAEGRGTEIGVKFRELPYFLQEAREAGFELPLTELLYAICDKGERVVIDDNRPTPSYFKQLAERRSHERPTP